MYEYNSDTVFAKWETEIYFGLVRLTIVDQWYSQIDQTIKIVKDGNYSHAIAVLLKKIMCPQ